MVIGWLAAAWAAPVVCDPDEAQRILDDARIDEVRAPVTHPQLVPGLARRTGTDAALQAALARLCTPDAELSVGRGPVWSGAGASAYAIVATRSRREGCSLVQERVWISVGIGDRGVRYRLFDLPPADRTPLGDDCDEQATWRQTDEIAGDARAVRLVLAVDHRGSAVVGSALEVQRASALGWTRQILAQPAPPRHLDPTEAGPWIHLGRTATGQTVVVASRNRTSAPCQAVGGQTVWIHDGEVWQSRTGRDALTFLAQYGLRQLAGDSGWLSIIAQDDATDAPLLGPRMRRLQRRDPESLYLFGSSDFPLLNPGYLVIAPGPWPTRGQAEAMRTRWGRGAYVKQAWAAPDPCVP